MSQDIKSRIIQLIENNSMVENSAAVISKSFSSIKSGEVQGSSVNEMDPDSVMDIYVKRRGSLENSGKNYYGLDELLLGLKEIGRTVRVVQLTASDFKVTVFLDSGLTTVIGVIAIES